MADLSVRYPRVVIEFCTACKWNLRAAYVRQYSHPHFPFFLSIRSQAGQVSAQVSCISPQSQDVSVADRSRSSFQ